MSVDSQFLMGLLAYQNGLITKQQLLDAFAAWVRDKSIHLIDILVKNRAIEIHESEVLAKLTVLQTKRFDSDIGKSIANLSSVGEIRSELQRIAANDAEAQNLVSRLAPNSSYLGNVDETLRYGSDLSSQSIDSNSNASGAPGRFRIVKEHAKGGLGVVFVAEDLQLRREVALKQIRFDRADYTEFRDKFQREAELTGQLEHPGVVPVYALGTDDSGRPYYAMRFIKGENLQSHIRKYFDSIKSNEKRFDPTELGGLLRRFIDVCYAISYAHDRGVLHRDLKPGNIMLGKHGETLIVDWGLAKPFAEFENASNQRMGEAISEVPIPNTTTGEETQYGTFVGTPAYAPPEQLLGQLDRLGRTSDTYALGAILYEILTGQAPVNAPTLNHCITKVTHGDFPSPRKLQPAIPRPLEAICLKSLSLDQSNRYQTAEELANDVERWLDDRPILALKQNFISKTARWSRKHPAFSTMAVLTVFPGVPMLLTLGTVIYAWSNAANAARVEKVLREQSMQREKAAEVARVEIEAQKMMAEKQTMMAEEQTMMAHNQKALAVAALREAEDWRSRAQKSETFAREQVEIAESEQIRLREKTNQLEKERDDSNQALQAFTNALFPKDSQEKVMNAMTRIATQRRELTKEEGLQLSKMLKKEILSSHQQESQR